MHRDRENRKIESVERQIQETDRERERERERERQRESLT